MIDSQGSWREQVVSFGPFRLHAARRTLERSGVALNIGSRTLELLIVLVERAGEVVSKNELMTRVGRTSRSMTSVCGSMSQPSARHWRTASPTQGMWPR